MPYQPVKKNATGGFIHDSGKADGAVGADVATESGTTAGKDLGTKGKSGEGMPKQRPDESAASYGARVRAWREENDVQTMARKKALGGK